MENEKDNPAKTPQDETARENEKTLADVAACKSEDLAKVTGGTTMRLDNHGRKPPL